MTSQPISRHAKWLWLIPITMLILASLACDDSYSLPPEVWQVEADAQNPGRAYALVYEGNQKDMTVSPSQKEAYKAYETDDYGQHWQPSDHVFSKSPVNSYPLTMADDDLYFNSRVIWSFPRPTFRQFFTEGNSTAPRFLLPYGTVSNSLQGDTLYMGMGSQGVLVGHVTSDMKLTDWQITANRIDLLNPLPLTIVNPATILGVTAGALLVPPYALLHSFLLYCLWVYLMPRKKARRYALYTTLFLMLVAAIGAAVWLTDVNTDFYPVVAAVTAITVLTGVTLTFIFSTGQSDTPNLGNLALAAALVSLVVPAGVAAIYLGWWAVYLLVFGYACFRFLFYRYLKPDADVWQERWLADSMALKTLVVAGLITLAVSAAFWGLRTLLLSKMDYSIEPLFELACLLIPILVDAVLIQRYVASRLRGLVKAKRGEDESLFLPGTMNRNIRIAAGGWLILSAVASVATFAAQATVQAWFTTLLR